MDIVVYSIPFFSIVSLVTVWCRELAPNVRLFNSFSMWRIAAITIVVLTICGLFWNDGARFIWSDFAHQQQSMRFIARLTVVAALFLGIFRLIAIITAPLIRQAITQQNKFELGLICLSITTTVLSQGHFLTCYWIKHWG